jgi:hypothetical protein
MIKERCSAERRQEMLAKGFRTRKREDVVIPTGYKMVLLSIVLGMALFGWIP